MKFDAGHIVLFLLWVATIFIACVLFHQQSEKNELDKAQLERKYIIQNILDRR